ncbi:hypothetical protein LCGC14_1737580 [marine sediment metagenome]|uniref:HEAT repeat domain-containing protein n=1 Tax=marine sediment metagenome TaxID=412755 RepID=A0A0F9JMY8_9ZZZZ
MAVLAVASGMAFALFVGLHYRGPEAKARRLIAELRGFPPGVMERWLLRLHLAKPRAVRQPEEVVRDLAELGEPAARAVIAASWGGPPAWEVLWQIGMPAVPIVVENLQAPDPMVRADCARSLIFPWAFVVGHIDPDWDMVDQSMPEDQVDRMTADVIAQAGPALIRALKDKHPYVRQEAASSLAYMSDVAGQALPALLEALADDDPGASKAAARAMANLWPSSGLPRAVEDRLVSCLRDTREHVRLNAAWALGAIGRPGADVVARSLEGLLESDSLSIRAVAGIALSEIGPPDRRNVAALIEGLSDGSPALREACAMRLEDMASSPPDVVTALGHMPLDEVMSGLTNALVDDVAEVRRLAAGALREIGPVSGAITPAAVRRAINALKGACQDDSAWVRDTAEEALRGFARN